MQKLLRKIWARYKIGLQSEFEYRWGSLIWILNQWVGTIFIMFLWYFAAKNSPGFPMSPSQVITYFLLSVPVSRLTQTWRWQNMEEDIRSGGLTKFLLRPQPYTLNELGESFSTQTIRLATLAPIFALILFFLRSDFSLPLSGTTILFTFFSLVLGFAVRFAYESLMGMTTFWLLDIHGFAAIVGTFSGIFSGANIPLSLMPPWLLNLAHFLPFRFFVSFPLEIALGQLTLVQVATGFIVGLFWLSLFSILYRPLFKKGIRQYEVVGI